MRTAWLALVLFSMPAMAWENQDKYLMSSFIVMQAIDVKQTDQALREGGQELNGLYGSHPSMLKIAAYKAAGTGLIYAMADQSEASRTELLIAVNLVQVFVTGHNYFYVQFGF